MLFSLKNVNLDLKMNILIFVGIKPTYLKGHESRDSPTYAMWFE